jgi:hypothetical protein
MSPAVLPMLRWIMLLAAVTAILQATILFRWVQRNFINRWLALGERLGQPAPPAAFTNERAQRIFPLLMAVVFLALWWYLGTPAGVQWWQIHVVPRPPV